MKLRKTLLYFLIFTTVSSLCAYKLVIKAYSIDTAYDIDSLKS